MKLVISIPNDNQTIDTTNDAERRMGLLGRVDVRNLGMVLLGFVLVLVLVPPVRAFPMDDDWAYSQSVADLLHWAYKPHDSSQALALGHIAWGALLSTIFGHNFTVLSISTLTMSALCLVVFYLLMRHLNVGPTQALLGTVLLGCNPIYVYLSYSFMTDVTFLAYMLTACLCYVRGIHRYGQHWYWLGGVAVGLAYLTRQLGILVVPAALLYLWWSRKWSWQSAIAIAAIPLAVLVSYSTWENTQPQRFVLTYLGLLKDYAISHPVDFVVINFKDVAMSLAVPGLCLLPLLWLPRKPIRAAPLLAYLLVSQGLYFQQAGTMFPAVGNIVSDAGFAIAYVATPPLWHPLVWIVLGIAGVTVFSLYTVTCVGWVLGWLRSHKQQSGQTRSNDPALFLYALGFMLAVPTFIASPDHFDRYILPFMPMLMLPSLRRIGFETAQVSNVWRWLLIIPIALFSIVGMKDYMAHASLRWQAAQHLVAQGAKYNQVDAGFEWMGQYLYADGVRYIRTTHDMSQVVQPAFAVLDPLYAVSYVPREGYTQIGSLPYQSWLEGGHTRYVLLLKRK